MVGPGASHSGYDMTIYARTQSGQALAFDANSGLPYKQRVILKMVDGSTRLDVFEDSLRAFGDVPGVFEALVVAGLIKPLPSQALRLSATPAELRPELSTSILEPHNAQQWFETDVGYRESSQPPTLALDSYMGPETVAVPYAGRNNRRDESDRRTLGRLVSLMDGFVRQNMPEQAQPVLEKLEEMASLEMFAVSLKGYEQLIKPFGASAESHMAQLKRILRDGA